MKQITLTSKEIKNIKRFIEEVSELSIVEGVYLLTTNDSNNQEHLDIVVLKNYTLDYYEKFPKTTSKSRYSQETLVYQKELLDSLIKKYNRLQSSRLSFRSDLTTNYNTALINNENIVNIIKLAKAEIIFDRFDYLNFLQEKYSASTYLDLPESNILIDNLEDVLYEFSNDQVKENFYEIKSLFLKKFLNFVFKQYHTYGQKPNVLINNVDLLWDQIGLRKVRAVRGYTITFSVDNIILHLSNVGLNHSMTLTQEDGITKYYGGFNLVSTEHVLQKNHCIQSVWYSDKGLKNYKICFKLRNDKNFMVDIQCDQNYYLLNEQTNLIEYLKNNEITFDNLTELYELITKFINPHSSIIKITDKEESYVLYEHKILIESQQVIISNDEEITTRRVLDGEHYIETKTIEKIVPTKPYTRKRK